MVELRFLFLVLFFRNMSIMIKLITMQSNKTGTIMLVKVDFEIELLDAESFGNTVGDTVGDDMVGNAVGDAVGDTVGNTVGHEAEVCIIHFSAPD